MGLAALTHAFPWTKYSKKLAAKLEKLRCAGIFTAEESEARAVQLAQGSAGELEDGNLVRLFWLVDPDDGTIIDAKFQAFGQTALLAAAEICCELSIGKNYDQAKRITATLIDQQVRDRSEVPAFPQETHPHISLVLEAAAQAAKQCDGIPLSTSYVAPPVPIDIGEIREGGYPGWDAMSKAERLEIIEQVLNQDIRPYIALDAGGVEVRDLIDGKELLIAYQGSCTSCYSSVGTTLSYIQQMLRGKVHPSLKVTPELAE